MIVVLYQGIQMQSEVDFANSEISIENNRVWEELMKIGQVFGKIFIIPHQVKTYLHL